MAYEPLPIVEVRIDDLHLDLENYRIPTRPDDESEALRYLFASEDVMGAARLILRDGYFDNEVPIVIEDGDGGYVVLEGNRRVSALKALHDPGIAPSHTTEVQALLTRYETEARDLPSEIRVLVAPDRATARPRIARLHTGSPKRSWTREQQAKFYYSLLDGDTTVDDIKATYPGAEVARFIKMAAAWEFLLAAPFSDASLREYVASNGLSMSSFEYAYRRQEIADAIGLKFDRDGLLLPRNSTPQKIAAALTSNQLAALEHLIDGFRAKRLNTRSAEFKEGTDEYRDFVARLGGATDPADTDGGDSPSDGTAAAAASGADSALPAADPPTSRGPNHPDTKPRLDLTGVDYESTPVNLHRRYQELRRLDLSSFPVAAAILLRSVFEMTIKWHFDPASPRPANGMLSEAFTTVEAAYGNTRGLKGTINAIRSNPANRPGSLKWFNLAAHDVAAVIRADDVRHAWEQVSPLLRYLLDSKASS